jgi:SSS family solute:Na+ symporter
VNIYLVLIIVYSLGVVALGVWTSRFIRQSSDFFVGGRSLGPGLIFATMLAANIGAGSTVGAAGQAYKDGIGAWWWVGSAGIGSLVFAFTVAPALWTLAKKHDFYTTADYLEFRYDRRVGAAAAIIVCLVAVTVLAAQLIAGAAILNVILGIPRWAGALIGAGIMTIYFVAGGLLGSAWVNTLQLGVLLAGFLTALPFVYIGVGGIGGVLNADTAPAWFGDFFYSTGPGSGWMFLLLTGPSFIISPGLIQKAYGAKSARALRVGIGLNAVVLMLFACLPVFFGMTARAVIPDYINDPNTVLPTFLMTQLPAWLGALALAAVFSTEVDTCDAILFMLSTSVSKDIYKRHVNPGASDAQLLRVARLAAVAGGAAGVVLSVVLATVISALTIFYSVIIVSLFVPIVGGLYIRRANANAALTSMAAGVITLFIVRFSIASPHWWRDPLVLGLGAAMVAFVMVLMLQRSAPERREI